MHLRAGIFLELEVISIRICCRDYSRRDFVRLIDFSWKNAYSMSYQVVQRATTSNSKMQAMKQDISELYDAIENVLRESADKGTILKIGPLGGPVKEVKRQLHLLGKDAVSILGRKPQQTYIAGVIEQKNFAGFYFMPIYSHPEEFSLTSPLLQNARKGKSCLNIKVLDAPAVRELKSLVKKGKALYKTLGWI